VTPPDSHEVDVVVVGAGAGGLVAALTAAARGLDTLVVERSSFFGGTSAMSGGSVWVPNAPEIVRQGGHDDPAAVLNYLRAIAGDRVSDARLRRYVEAAPAMMAELEGMSSHLRAGFFWAKGYPDYHPDQGGSADGRGLQAKPIDQRALGSDEKRLRGGMTRIKGLPRGMWLTGVDLHSINRIRWGTGLGPYKTLARLLWRTVRARLLGERIAPNGSALMSRLWLAAREAQIPTWFDMPMQRLVTDESGRVCGIVAERDGEAVTIKARCGVILACGGFGANADLRRKYQPTVGDGWSLASVDDLGDGQLAGEAVGAALEMMEEAWWYPVALLPGSLGRTTAERQYPGQYIVNGAGRRFVNEACPYTDFGRAQIEGHHTGTSHIPAWMIIDGRAWRRNIIFAHFPGRPAPKDWVVSGHVKKADTLEALAIEMGVPPDALAETGDRFNRFARAGRDDDFHRGETVYENYYADPTQPNPNLAEVSEPPFYAFQIYPGDIGTNGGLATDEHARVVNGDGAPIRGLFACGNVTASVMGTSYAGLGATIGAAMTFGWVAATAAATPDGEAAFTNPAPVELR
jgi:3-oxosteroid 1-dehydrogenase